MVGSLAGVDVASLSLEVPVLELGTKVLARDVDALAAHNNDVLAVQDLLGDNGGEATEEVTTTVDNKSLC